MTQRRKGNHFLAQHLLRHFADGEGLVRFRRRSEGWAECVAAASNLAKQNYLYSPGAVDFEGHDPKDDSMEVWLDRRVDTPAASPIRRLVEGASVESLTSDERHAIAFFVAVQDMRTPCVRDLLVPALSFAGADGASNFRSARRALRENGVYVTLGEIKRKRPPILEQLPAEAKSEWFRFMQRYSTPARLELKSRLWTMLDAPTSMQFVTSDIGIVKAVVGFETPVGWEMGFHARRLSWLVPLSPRRALAMTPNDFPAPEPPSASTVAAVNYQFILDAPEFIYSWSAIDAHVFEAIPRIASGAEATRKLLSGFLRDGARRT